MHALLAVMALAGVNAPSTVYTCPTTAAAKIAPNLETGSLLFHDGKCLVVKMVSRSKYTHVATVVKDRGRCFVYDSQNGIGVRRQTLEEYLKETVGEEIEVLDPARAFPPERQQGYSTFLQSQLDRPYAVAHHVTGKKQEGVHCAEYVTSSLVSVDVISANNPARVSPASLRSGILKHHIYEFDKRVLIKANPPQRKPGKNWCSELWLDTKDCCRSCWGGFSACVLCQ